MPRKSKVIECDQDFISFLNDMYPYEKNNKLRTQKLTLDMWKFKNPSKKGSFSDITYILISLLILTFVSLIVMVGVNKFNTQIQGLSIADTTTKAVSQQLADQVPRALDTSLVLFFWLSIIGTLILASLIPANWIFIVFYIFISAFSVMFGGFISNIYETAAQVAIISDEADKLVLLSYTFQYLPWITAIVGLILAFIMWKTRPNPYNMYGGPYV